MKYCSSYQGHSYMVDERRIDETFRVVLSEETEIIENLEHLHFILLTGEAGDGKSHLLRSLGQRLSDYRFQIYQDFSALPEEKWAMPIDDRQEPGKKELIKLIVDIIEGKSEQRIIITANVGIFTKRVFMYHEQLLDMLNKKNDGVKIINFEKRNLADDRDAFQQIVESFYTYDGKECQDNECKQWRHCAYEKNIDFLKSTSGIMASLRDNVAMVLQKNVLFSGTIKENLRWGKEDATDEEIVRACRLAQADEFIRDFPAGYDTRIERGGANVSGGQKQRLCIARALLKKPKILILDDSTSAVDTKTDALIRRAFREEIPDTTKIIIAQRISSIQDADRILVFDSGRMEAAGTHAELLESCPIYREIYESQTKEGGDDESGK